MHTAFNSVMLEVELVLKGDIHLHTNHLPRGYGELAGPLAHLMVIP